MSPDPSYFAARAVEHRRYAMASTDPRVRRVHLELAAKYAVLAGPAAEGEGPFPEQDAQTA